MEEIAKILKSYPPDCQPTSIEPLGSAGGLSGARFWRIVAPRGALVLRCWPHEHPTPEGLQFIHAVLRHAATHGVHVLPVPIAGSSGVTFLHHAGHLWELAPWLPGTADYEQSPSLEKLRAAMTALVQFHLAVAGFLATSSRVSPRGAARAVTHRLSRLRELQSGGADVLTHSIKADGWPDLAPLAREFAFHLPDALPRAIADLAPLADVALPLQPCIRDIWHDHILFEGDTVTGIVDFGAVQIDTPATDVARLLGSLVGNDAAGWRAGLDAYAAVRPLSPDEMRAIPALDEAGTILALCNWIHWIYIDGRKFDNELQVIDRFRRTLRRLRRRSDQT